MDVAPVDRLAAVASELQDRLNLSDRHDADELGVGGADDLQVLRLLADHGPLRVGELAERQSTSVATASARLDRLEKRGFVVRERVPSDRRVVQARLTPGGSRIAMTSRMRRRAELAGLADDFPIDELQRLVDAIGAERLPAAPS